MQNHSPSSFNKLLYFYIWFSRSVRKALCLSNHNTSCFIPLAISSKLTNQLRKPGINPIWGAPKDKDMTVVIPRDLDICQRNCQYLRDEAGSSPGKNQ